MACLFAAASMLPILAGDAPAQTVRPRHKPGEFIVKLKRDVQIDAAKAKLSALAGPNQIQIVSRRQNAIRIKVADADPGNAAKTAAIQAAISRVDVVERVEPNYLYYASDTSPGDPRVSQLWFLEKIRAPQGWDIRHDSPEIVVAVIDTGVFLDHGDLKDNLWVNPAEIPGNNADDDGNGIVDDVHGADFRNNDGDPSPEFVPVPIHPFFCSYDPAVNPDLFTGREFEQHGSHVCGTIGAAGGNGKGITGVTWKVKLMPLKFLGGPCGSGDLGDALRAIEYAIDHKSRIISNSWGGPYSEFLREAVEEANHAGILFVAAAGNEGVNLDESPATPASYNLPNVLGVAATDKADRKAAFSNFGDTVHLAAPGVDILSTVPGGKAPLAGPTPPMLSDYASFQGTSMATPIVSGAAALVMARYPSLSHLEVKALLLKSADAVPELKGVAKGGRRLNVFGALKEPALPQSLQAALQALPPQARAAFNERVTPDDKVRMLLYPAMNNRMPAGDSPVGTGTDARREDRTLQLLVKTSEPVKPEKLPEMLIGLNARNPSVVLRKSNVYEVTVSTSLGDKAIVEEAKKDPKVMSAEIGKTYKRPDQPKQ